MNLEGLRTFLTIIETGSLAKAAKTLNLTQSTITARLQQLEQEMGQQLINRHRRGAQMTAAGMRLQRYAQTIEELWRQARQETAVPEGINAICNLGCDPDLWDGLGKRLFDHINQHQTQVALSIWHGTSAMLSAWLDQGRIDLALTYSPAKTESQTTRALPADHLRLYSTQADSPVLGDPGYVFVEAGEGFGKDHAAAYSGADVARLSFGSATLGLEHILSHGGSAYLPERLAQERVAAGELFEIGPAPDFRRPAHLIVNEASAQRWPWFSGVLTDLNL